jgi:predicted TIM-barrel fold metal-dependent hydrolase
MKPRRSTRRQFVVGGLAASVCGGVARDGIIDIHCHSPIPAFHTEKWLIEHQRHHGVRVSMLLPINSAAGIERIPNIARGLLPKFALGQGAAMTLAAKYPGEFQFFTTADARDRDSSTYLEKHLRAGAVGIGEVKLPLECDSPLMSRIYDVARSWGVPVLIHFQHGLFATGIERFYRVAAKYPSVTFIGHAQTWWGNIGRLHHQETMYPEGPIVAGGITDRLLADFPNIYGDLSAYSGFHAIARNQNDGRQLLARHENKLLLGSDCQHSGLEGPSCWGGRTLQLIRMLAPSADAVRKIVHDNALRIWKERLSNQHEFKRGETALGQSSI